jgi:urate oxidase
MKLLNHSYGKAQVRVLKVLRRGRRDWVKDLEVAVMLRGIFADSYTKGDNHLVVATDTIKNVVNLLAHRSLGQESEAFGLVLGRHFLSTYRQVSQAEVRLTEHRWERLAARGRAQDHAFVGQGGGTAVAEITVSRKESVVRSGIRDLLVLKTSGSGFEGFLKDEHTTLSETKDRLLCTKINALWTYTREPDAYSRTNRRIIDALLSAFPRNYSPSVQKTLFEMGEAALKAAREISTISLALPNVHHLLVNLSPFGVSNRNELFVPTEEPYGVIEGTVAR